MKPTVRSLGLVGIAAGLVLVGCGESDPQDPGSQGAASRGANSSPAAEPNALPQPRNPGLRLTMDEFPITVRPMGVETSPSLGGEPAEPGDTQLGLMVEYRGARKDRPTPAPGSFDLSQWVLVYPPPNGAECAPSGEPDPGDPCIEGVSASALFDEHTGNSQGVRLFQPKEYMEEHVEGDMTDENMQTGTGYFVEFFAPIPESLNPAEVQVCAANPTQAAVAEEVPEDCLDLANLPQLAQRG